MSVSKPPRPRLAFNVDKAALAEPAQPSPSPTASIPALAPTAAPKVVPAHRATRKVVQVWLNPEAFRQLKIMSARDGVTMQENLLEALDDLFQKRGEHRLARGLTDSLKS